MVKHRKYSPLLGLQVLDAFSPSVLEYQGAKKKKIFSPCLCALVSLCFNHFLRLPS